MTQPEIRDLQEYFILLRKRPGMYLGNNTITKLFDHLQGYLMATWFNRIENHVDDNFFKNFHEFICNYYEVTTTQSWCGIILEQSFGNEQTALNTFFELFDLFMADVKSNNSKKIVLGLFETLVTRRDHIERDLGDNFTNILIETFDLITQYALSNLKYDYDEILEQLRDKATNIPELEKVLVEIENQMTPK